MTLCDCTALQDLEIVSFIKGDLERLYMNGVDDEYFKSPIHQHMLLNILFIWATRHRRTGYRQGMHEIVAPVLLVLQQEREEWAALIPSDPSDDTQAIERGANTLSSPSTEVSSELSFHVHSDMSALARCFSEEYLEANTYWLFERIMTELEPLYSPVTGADEQPMVVHYCTRIQGGVCIGYICTYVCVHCVYTYVVHIYAFIVMSFGDCMCVMCSFVYDWSVLCLSPSLIRAHVAKSGS